MWVFALILLSLPPAAVAEGLFLFALGGSYSGLGGCETSVASGEDEWERGRRRRRREGGGYSSNRGELSLNGAQYGRTRGLNEHVKKSSPGSPYTSTPSSAAMAAVPLKPNPHGWGVYFDAASQRKYRFNAKTGESIWETEGHPPEDHDNNDNNRDEEAPVGSTAYAPTPTAAAAVRESPRANIPSSDGRHASNKGQRGGGNREMSPPKINLEKGRQYSQFLKSLSLDRGKAKQFFEEVQEDTRRKRKSVQKEIMAMSIEREQRSTAAWMKRLMTTDRDEAGAIPKSHSLRQQQSDEEDERDRRRTRTRRRRRYPHRRSASFSSSSSSSSASPRRRGRDAKHHRRRPVGTRKAETRRTRRRGSSSSRSRSSSGSDGGSSGSVSHASKSDVKFFGHMSNSSSTSSSSSSSSSSYCSDTCSTDGRDGADDRASGDGDDDDDDDEDNYLGKTRRRRGRRGYVEYRKDASCCCSSDDWKQKRRRRDGTEILEASSPRQERSRSDDDERRKWKATKAQTMEGGGRAEPSSQRQQLPAHHSNVMTL
eukprot:jgi/Bigna1/134825/aug1.27_g9533